MRQCVGQYLHFDCEDSLKHFRIMTPDVQFEDVVKRFRSNLHAFLRRRVPNETIADDLLQEVWVKVARNLGELPAVKRTDAWLYQIARNVLIDFYRRQRATTAIPDDLPAEPDDATVGMLQGQLSGYVHDVVESLSEPYREALRLTLYEDISQVDLAKRLGLSVSAAKSRVQRARAEVRRQMEKCCDWGFDSYGNVTSCEPRRKDSCKQC